MDSLMTSPCRIVCKKNSVINHDHDTVYVHLYVMMMHVSYRSKQIQLFFHDKKSETNDIPTYVHLPEKLPVGTICRTTSY